MQFWWRTGGESHGKGCLAVLEGVPKDVVVDRDWIDGQLRRRQRGYGRSRRQKIETDSVEILGGVRHGRTLAGPVVLWVANRDATIEGKPELSRPRPGHADLSGCLRHGDRDIRANLERASARETAARVAAGALAALVLREIGVEVLGHAVAIGTVETSGARGLGVTTPAELTELRRKVEASELGVVDPSVEPAMKAEIDAASARGDTLGGIVEVVAAGVPPGLGGFTQWDRRLDARLAQAVMSIQAFKAVEIGLGVEVARRPGTQVHDAILPGPVAANRASNHAGGIEGGITNGQPVVLRGAKKPISTLRRPLASVDLATGEASEAGFERSDICAVPAASVIAEAMTALVLLEAALDLFGGATITAFREAARAHRARADDVVGPSRDTP